MKILLWPHPTLKLVSEPLERPPLPTLVAEMFRLMEEAGGVGLSAIQIGVAERLVVSHIDGHRQVWVNPSWTKVSGDNRVTMLEGCLSTPGQFETVQRYTNVTAHFQDEKMEHHHVALQGLAAQMMQHECEHLDGRFFLDQVSPANRSRVMGVMMKLKRGSNGQP